VCGLRSVLLSIISSRMMCLTVRRAGCAAQTEAEVDDDEA
jgi:hypothetical protein